MSVTVQRTRRRLYETPTTENCVNDEAAMPESREHWRRSDHIIYDNIFWSASLGAVPLPGIDLLLVSTIQLKMINQIAMEYGQPFSRYRAKAILGALGGGGAVAGLSLLKLIPGVVSFGGGVSFAIYASASTYAVGKLFQRHFEAGGSLTDFDTAAAKKELPQLVEEGKRQARMAKKRA
ncbi:DUF697 domain-containing protein [Ectothiorhodospiraceae bacterium BW-2]|nr:DUF697 domain-containing protein [Ectothiorhodospiraceae bacterium BW-2]